MYEGERFNSISHLVGVGISLIGVSVLMTLAVLTKDPFKIVSCLIYGLSAIFLFTFSTLYHSLRGRAKAFFQKMDYAAIYLMIAGSYAPFTLITLRERDGWLIFTIVWGLAIIGTIQDLWRESKTRRTSLVIYLIMGWLIVFNIKSLWMLLSQTSLFLLVGGGLFYTFGIIFFVNDHRWKHAHGIWHLFVLAGAILQYFSVVLNVV